MYQTWNRLLHPELSWHLIGELSPITSSSKSFFSPLLSRGYIKLSVIYAVHCPCHGSPYEPYLEDQ